MNDFEFIEWIASRLFHFIFYFELCKNIYCFLLKSNAQAIIRHKIISIILNLNFILDYLQNHIFNYNFKGSEQKYRQNF